MSNEPEHDPKADIRADMRQRLNALSDQDRQGQSAAACARLATVDAFRHANVVMLYMPLAREVDLTPAAIRCFQLGKTVCVPRVDWDRHDMTPVEVSSFDDHVMDVDIHGLRQPRDGRPVLLSLIDIVVVPGLAFDTQGNRLGRGGGFYDRFLTRIRPGCTRIGLGFDFQIVDHVPVNERDMSVDIVVTDRRVAHTNPQRHRPPTTSKPRE